MVISLVDGGLATHTTATLPLRMQRSLDGATTYEEKRNRINMFKDQEIFQIDLDHILNPSVDFRELSVRLTLLAEIMVAQAAQLVYDHLVERFGHPCQEDGARASWAILGLGKLGGIALGYASDIELLFIYSAVGITQGDGKAISNSEFFELLARETTQFIRTKREGIFEIDLRLRPYGKEGPLASSVKHFSNYYGSGGPAHSFEKLALVRMRWIAGDPALGSKIEQMRDEYVYENPQLDLASLWDIWGRQREQKQGDRRLNAKYSRGSLVDLEGTLQLLQVMHANHVPQLRTPRLSGVIEALRRAGVVNAQEYADLVGAYHFLRRLINALRMLRGNAQDLFLPAEKSVEYTHLARRMGYELCGDISPAQQLADEFKHRTAAVRVFVEDHFDQPPPGGRPGG
jgi:glutamate-ammonia-ligase adenylyltransferase